MATTTGSSHYSFDLRTEHRARSDAIRNIRAEAAQILEDSERQRRSMRQKMYRDLKDSGVDRRKKVQAIRNSAHEDLAAFKRMRRERRVSYENERREFARSLRDETKRIREKSRESLNDFARMRAENSRNLREQLRESREVIRQSVDELRVDFADVRHDRLLDIDAMRSDWQQMTGNHRRKRAGVSPASAANEGEELAQLKEALLKSINESPGGISLTAIGAQLEVEWRRLIRPAKELLEHGKIRKEDVEYFPAQREEGGGEGGVETEEESEQIQI